MNLEWIDFELSCECYRPIHDVEPQLVLSHSAVGYYSTQNAPCNSALSICSCRLAEYKRTGQLLWGWCLLYCVLMWKWQWTIPSHSACVPLQPVTDGHWCRNTLSVYWDSTPALPCSSLTPVRSTSLCTASICNKIASTRKAVSCVAGTASNVQ